MERGVTMIDRVLKMISGIILAALTLTILGGCKHKGVKDIANTRSFRTGSDTGLSCSSHANYHRRNKEELSILAKEFLSACFLTSKDVGQSGASSAQTAVRQVNAGGVGQPSAGQGLPSIWDSIYQIEAGNQDLGNGYRFNPNSIFRYESVNNAELARFIKSTKAERLSSEKSELIKDLVDHQLLPSEFLPGASLAKLGLLEGIENGESDVNRRDWRPNLKSFSPMCKAQILAMRDRALQIAQAYKGFVEKRCCAEVQGGQDFSKGTLACAGMDYAKLKTKYPSKISEWPTCGTIENAVCGPDSIFPVPSAQDPAQCFRCELRWSSRPWYKPQSDPRAIDYDVKLARESQITCRSPASARSAIATWCVNQQNNVCKGLDLERTPVQEIFAKISPHLHCAAVSVNGEPTGQPIVDGKSSSLSYGFSSQVGGDFSSGAAAKVNAGFLDVFSVEAAAEIELANSVSATKVSKMEVRSNGSDPIYTLRNGRLEFSPRTAMSCSVENESESCLNQSYRAALAAGASLPLPFIGAGVRAHTGASASQGQCSSIGVSHGGADGAEWVAAGGLSLDQAMDICAGQNAYNEPGKFGVRDAFNAAAVAVEKRFAKGGDFKDWLPTAVTADDQAKEIFSIDISRRSFYCTRPGSVPTEDGTKFNRIALKVDGSGQLIMVITVSGKGGILRSSEKTLNITIASEDQNILAVMMNPELSNSDLRTAISELMARKSDTSLFSSSLGDYKGQTCNFVDLPVEFDLRSSPFQCFGAGDSAYWPLDQISLKLDQEYLVVTALSNKRGKFTVEQNADYFGDWAAMIRAGTVTAYDAIKILEVAKAMDSGQGYSCMPSN